MTLASDPSERVLSRSCASCVHSEPAPRYPGEEYRHCELAAKHRGVPLRAWAGARCVFEPPKWEPVNERTAKP